MKYTVRTFLTVALLAASTTITYAQLSAPSEQRTITIVPPSESTQVNPGDTKQGVLKVINDSDQTLNFTAQTQDFIVEDNKGTPTLLPPGTLNNKYSAATWLAVSPSSFSVAPHQKSTLTYIIKVPVNARPGGHYAAVVYNPAEALGVAGTGTAVKTQIGSLFSISVTGKVNQFANATKIFANSFQEFGPVDVFTQIKNYGDIHIKPLGSITISDMVGRKLASLPLDEHNIFPQAARDYQNTYGQQWMLGRYKASLLASYGAQNNMPIVATIYFWVFPWRIASIVLVALVAIIIAILLYRRKKKQDKMVEQMNNEMVTEESSTPVRE